MSFFFYQNQSRTCELAKDYPHLLSSRQCTREEDDSVTKQMCIHSEEEVISDIRSQIYLAEETDRELPKTIFVATDHVAMEEELQAAFPDVRLFLQILFLTALCHFTQFCFKFIMFWMA